MEPAPPGERCGNRPQDDLPGREFTPSHQAARDGQQQDETDYERPLVGLVRVQELEETSALWHRSSSRGALPGISPERSHPPSLPDGSFGIN